MAGIRFKKPIFPISKRLREYLIATNREIDVPITYQDLTHSNSTITLLDKKGNDTLWETMLYSESDREYIHESLRKVYAQLKVAGDISVIEHLYIDRVDFCLYANTHPFRIRIVNKLNDLFDYLKNDEDLVIIKSCVFHYEMEFIHPFIDGNGRMGRLWQTLILKDSYPVFEFLPIETLIKERQEQYYEFLGKSDNTGESTVFIEFMLEIILESLEELLNIQNVSLMNIDRINLFKSIVKNDYFTRKEYLKNFREISSATASRDLNFGVENGMIEKIGDKNTTRYKYK